MPTQGTTACTAIQQLPKSDFPTWLVVSTPLKNISQMGLLFPIYGKIKFMLQTTNQFSNNRWPMSPLKKNRGFRLRWVAHRPGEEKISGLRMAGDTTWSKGRQASASVPQGRGIWWIQPLVSTSLHQLQPSKLTNKTFQNHHIE